MKTAKKVAIIVAVSLIAAGIALFAAGFAMVNFNFKEMSPMEYTTNTHKITEDFSSININISTADICFIVSDDGESRVECYETEKRFHTVSVGGDTLTIREQKNFNIFDYINFDFNKPRVTLYLSRTQFDALNINSDTSLIVIPDEFSFANCNITNSTGDVKYTAPTSGELAIQVTTGRIMVSDISPKSIVLTANTGHVTLTSAKVSGNVCVTTSTGRIYLRDIECQDLSVTSSTGNKDIAGIKCKDLSSASSTGRSVFEDVIASGIIKIEADTGDVKLERCDAAELFIKTDTGDVEGTLLSDKIFLTQTDTGRIIVPKSTTGGKCEIETDTGDITMSIVK